jgi:hypothetical protein
MPKDSKPEMNMEGEGGMYLKLESGNEEEHNHYRQLNALIIC